MTHDTEIRPRLFFITGHNGHERPVDRSGRRKLPVQNVSKRRPAYRQTQARAIDPHLRLRFCLANAPGREAHWTSATSTSVARFGLREPAAAQCLLANAGQVRLDVEDGRTVEHVDAAHVQSKTFATQEFYDR